MTKFLYYTDTHFKAKNPKSRRDNFAQTILGKMDNVCEVGLEEDVDVFLDGGDLYDHAVQSPWEIMAMYEAIRKRHTYTLAIAGNHPFRGNVEVWKEFSGLYLMAKLLGPKYQIRDPWITHIIDSDVTIWMHHTDLVRKPVIWKHVLWDDYLEHNPECKAGDIVLVSHYHPQQGVHEIDGVTFVSPGAVSRGTLAEDDLTRKPAFALLDIRGPGDWDIEIRTLPHQPADVVFDEHSTIRLGDINHDLEVLTEAVESLRNVDEDKEAILTPIDLLRLVHPSTNTSDRALEHAIERLQVQE